MLAAACSGLAGACGGSPGPGEAAPAGSESAAAKPTAAPDLTVGVAADGVVTQRALRAVDLLLAGEERAVADLVTGSAGRLTAASGLNGRTAIRFPPYSAMPDGPIAIVRVDSAGGDWMSPLRRDIVFGLDVNVDAASSGTKRDNGDNLLQRGLFVDDAQFKIQLDHHVPSCVIRGKAGRVIAKLPHRVQANQWYRITCSRRDDTVLLSLSRLDDRGRVSSTMTTTASGKIGSMEFAPLTPLSIGGKLGPDDEPAAATDQFNGLLDNIHLTVGDESDQR